MMPQMQQGAKVANKGESRISVWGGQVECARIEAPQVPNGGGEWGWGHPSPEGKGSGSAPPQKSF